MVGKADTAAYSYTENKDDYNEVPIMNVAKALLVVLIHRYLGGLLDPFVTLLEVDKLMYFMQEAGEPLHLNYIKATYGFYAENLIQLLREVEGRLIVGYVEGADAAYKPLMLVSGAIQQTSDFLNKHADSRKRFERVGHLIDGFESPYGLDLLSTVHWLMKREVGSHIRDVAPHIQGWNQSKRQFTPRQITIAADRLTAQGWMRVA
jgi:hypothetical protein